MESLRIRLLEKVALEARKLIDAVRSSPELQKEVPWEALSGAIEALNANSLPNPGQWTHSPPPFSSPLRILRDQMKKGKRYLLHARGGAAAVEFRHQGDYLEDCRPGQTPPSFWAETTEGSQKWFYADCGLEPYRPHSKEPWWHSDNWVSPVDLDEETLGRILESLPSRELDYGDLVE